jgi:hypothetical protein
MVADPPVQGRLSHADHKPVDLAQTWAGGGIGAVGTAGRWLPGARGLHARASDQGRGAVVRSIAFPDLRMAR